MDYVLEIKNLKVNYKTIDDERTVLDIDHIGIPKGKTYGLVGESGAGKTVLALTILRLLQCPPGQIVSGEILLNGEDLLKKTEKEMRSIRGRKIAMIFQDPMSSLNPVYTIREQMVNVVRENRGLKGKEAEQAALDMIRTVKLPDPEKTIEKYPHELSGGQRQRVIIGMALLCGAEFLIADEPTRNLDVTIQAGVLKLLADLQKQFGVTVLFIANNLGLISAVADEMGVLHNGVIVDRGDAKTLLQTTEHPYTKKLISAVTQAKKDKPKCVRSVE